MSRVFPRLAAVVFLLSLAPVGSAATFTVTSTADSGPGSLRQAILDANGAAGADTIAFSIGSGSQLISVASTLPAATDTVTIDGRTQPGYAGSPLIGIDGSSFFSSNAGLTLQGAGSAVYGLSITGFRSSSTPTAYTGTAAISIEAPNCIVKKCWLGIARDGITTGGNDHDIDLRSTGAIIGAPGEGNVISGSHDGICHYRQNVVAAGGNTIQNNIIGFDPTGTIRKPNAIGLVLVADGDTVLNNFVGTNGTDAWLSGTGLVVKGNKFSVDATGKPISGSRGTPSIYIFPESLPSASVTFGGPNPGEGNEVSGTYEGLNITGPSNTRIEGNHFHGVTITPGAPGATGDAIHVKSGQAVIIANSIHDNLGAAVFVDAVGDTITKNSIYGNTRGIVLSTFPPVQNDPGDLNGYQNYPVLQSASSAGSSTTVTGTINSKANQNVHIEFFNTTECGTFSEQGKTYLGSTDVATNGSGDASFNVVLPVSLISGTSITATATGASGSTSVFSACTAVSGAGVLAFAPASSNPNVSEKGPSIALTVTRTGGAMGAVSVDYSTASGTATAGADFATTSGTLTFADGQTSATITVPIIDDSVFEGFQREQFTVTLSNVTGGATLGSPSVAAVSISDNEAPSELKVTSTRVTEGNSGTTNLPFTVTLSAPMAVTATVSYHTVGFGAEEGVDFLNTSGQLTFNPGETQKVINVPVIGDTVYEYDESLDLLLDSPTNSLLFAPNDRVRGTIVNDEPGPPISIDDISVREGNSGDTQAAFTVTLSGATLSGWLDVYVQVQSGSAQLGSDFDGTFTTLRFNQGETKKTVPVTIHGDTQIEPDEKFTATITYAGNGTENATLVKPTGTCTIVNDDLGMTSIKLPQGTTGRMTIYLGNPLSTSGSVTVTSSQPQVAEVPSVFLAESGRSTIGFDVHALSTGTSVITAKLPPSLGGATLVANVEVVTDAPTGVFVTQVSPPNGPVTGGTQTTLSGLNFAAPCSVTFGSDAAADVSFVSATSLKATTPPHAAGTVDVGVTCGTDHYTLANGFLYTADAPHLSSLSPAAGATRGGTLVVLSGAGLSSSCGVRFGDADAKIVNDLSPDQLVVNSPAHDAGSVDVRLQCGETSTTLPAAFTYVLAADSAAVIAEVDPLAAAPGQSVTIKGVGFRTSDAIAFGNLRANVISTMPAAHVAVVPDIAPGKVAISLIDSDGHSSTTGPIFTVLEHVTPKITSVSPSRVAPGGELVITGEGFRAPYTFALDGTNAGTIVDLTFTRAVVRIDPSRAAGSYTLGVLDAAGNPVAAGPTIEVGSALGASSLSPICATTIGGGDVTITGSGFQSGATVRFGAASATNVRVIDDHTIQATVPQGRLGWPVVTITNPNGDTTTLTRGFFYYSPYDRDGGCASTKTRGVRH